MLTFLKVVVTDGQNLRADRPVSVLHSYQQYTDRKKKSKSIGRSGCDGSYSNAEFEMEQYIGIMILINY